MADESNFSQTEKLATNHSVRKTEVVTIKGTAGGLLVRLRDDNSVNFEELMAAFTSRLQNGEKFFRGAHTSVDLGRRELATTELEALQQILASYDVKLEHLVSGSQTTRSAARQLGLNFKLPNSHNTRPPAPEQAEGERAASGLPFDSAEALFMRRTLRSGQLIRHHADVCLLGDVNPGAEIIAGGSIVVWGSLRGAVHAGAIKNSDKSGEEASSAIVCALQLNPMQLGIGDLMTHAPENGIITPFGPEIAYISNGQIIVEPWQPGKKILRGAN